MKRKLSELIEFSSTGENDARTVYFDPDNKKLFVGKSADMKQFISSSWLTIFTVTVLNRILNIRGLLPLVFSYTLMLVVTFYLFRQRKRTAVVDVSPYPISQAYIDLQKKNGRKTYVIILIFFVITVCLSWAYLTFSGLFLLFVSSSMWHVFLLLLGTRQNRKNIILKQIEKDFKRGLYD